ncbi:MAG: putative bifunctional diguanylate cyclase/phosphodiesterase [Pseudomonadota bacterium]
MGKQPKAPERHDDIRRQWPLVLQRGPLLIALLYALVGALWIMFGDLGLTILVDDPASVQRLQTWKGLIYIALTAVLLYLAMCSLYAAIVRISAEAMEREARFQEMARHIPEVFWVWDPWRHRLSYVSPAAGPIWGVSVDALMEDPGLWMRSVHPQDSERVAGTLEHMIRHHQGLSQQYRIQRTDGAWRWIQDRVYPICDDDGELVRVVGVTEDITEQHYQQEALYQAAHYDRLTGLPNRYLFHERLEQQCHDAVQNSSTFALLFLDLDRFKYINDSLGHTAGDELLRQVAQRLQKVIESRGYPARLGGDEFAVLLSRREDMEQREGIVRELLDELSRPYVLQGERSFVTLSIGVALFSRDGSDSETLTRSADVAMYSAKRHGRNHWSYFHEEDNPASAERLRLEADIHRAVERQEFELHYQAQFTADGARMNGAECLLRWQHPEHGMISPGEFIPLLEETGLIVDVGIQVIEQACRSLSDWLRQGLPQDFVLAVNVSARQLRDEHLLTETRRLIEAYDVPTGMLELELTESSLMEEPAHSRRLFEGLRSIGVKIAIDDFGTRYSSLNYLREFAPDILKIDKSFVDPVAENERDRRLLEGIIHLAHTLGIGVIGEGVETEAQRAILEQAGCDWIQGFLLARPQALSGFEGLMGRVGAITAADTARTWPQ